MTTPIEAAPHRIGEGLFDLVVLNMVLHCTRDLSSTVRAAYTVLRPNGIVLVSLPHPAFYLSGRDDAPMFAPTEERAFRLAFRIRGHESHPEAVWYFHRPVSAYINGLSEAGFQDLFADEPYQIGPGRPHDVFMLAARRGGRVPDGVGLPPDTRLWA